MFKTLGHIRGFIYPFKNTFIKIPYVYLLNENVGNCAYFSLPADSGGDLQIQIVKYPLYLEVLITNQIMAIIIGFYSLHDLLKQNSYFHILKILVTFKR